MTNTPRTWEAEFDKLFTTSHPGDSGLGGGDPQEPVYEVTEIDPNQYKSFIRTIEDEAVRRTKDNLMGLIIRNSTGFISQGRKKLWYVDVDAVEKDLLNDN